MGRLGLFDRRGALCERTAGSQPLGVTLPRAKFSQSSSDHRRTDSVGSTFR